MVEPDLSAMHRSELEATIVSQTKVMERFRNKLGIIVLGIEDEGDRAYFGSTNDADELREIESDMLDSLNILECPWMHGRDLHAEMRGLRASIWAADFSALKRAARSLSKPFASPEKAHDRHHPHRAGMGGRLLEQAAPERSERPFKRSRALAARGSPP